LPDVRQYQLPPPAGGDGSSVLSPVTQITGTVVGTGDNIVISGASLTNLAPFGFNYPFILTVELTDQLTGATTTSIFGYAQPDNVPQVP
jgi:hypothetical protein